MRSEVKATVKFVAKLLESADRTIPASSLAVFVTSLREILSSSYRHHWFPETPCKGSGYRCLRLNHNMDPLIARAGEAAGLTGSRLRASMPQQLTMWCDPGEVSYRIGDCGSVCVIYETKQQLLQQQQQQHQRLVSRKPVLHPSSTYRFVPLPCKYEAFAAPAAIGHYPGLSTYVIG